MAAELPAAALYFARSTSATHTNSSKDHAGQAAQQVKNLLVQLALAAPAELNRVCVRTFWMAPARALETMARPDCARRVVVHNVCGDCSGHRRFALAQPGHSELGDGKDPSAPGASAGGVSP